MLIGKKKINNMGYWVLPPSRKKILIVDTVSLSIVIVFFVLSGLIEWNNNVLHYSWMLIIPMMIVGGCYRLYKDLFSWKQIRLEESGLFQDNWGLDFNRPKETHLILQWDKVTRISLTQCKDRITRMNYDLLIRIEYYVKKKNEIKEYTIHLSDYRFLNTLGYRSFEPKICNPIREIAKKHNIKIFYY